jgi:dihydrofolate reductase
MGNVIVDLSMSLDGFFTGPNDSIELPLGEGGERLHEWIFGSATGRGREVLQEAFESTGATVMGRRWFDIGEQPWGNDPPFHVPVFVVTHHPRETIKKGRTTFTFITDGIESTLEKAQVAAGEKNVDVGAANIAQQYLQAGLVDEIQIHLVPILLGEGVRLFENLGPEPIELERTRIIELPDVTHIQYRVVK